MSDNQPAKEHQEIPTILPFQRKNGIHFCYDLHTNLSALQLFLRDLQWKIFTAVQMEIFLKILYDYLQVELGE